jgi:putative hydrolases of HD superfamily
LESKFVHDVDKIELVLQMVEYERAHKHQLDLSEFAWVARRIVSQEVKAWADEVLLEREVFWGRKGHDAFRQVEPDLVIQQAQKEYYGA